MTDQHRREMRGLREALALLQRLMKGDRLTVSSALVQDGPHRAAVQRRLRCLAEELECVRGDRGRPEAFRWIWPTDQRPEPEAIWSLAAAQTLLHAFHESMVGETLRRLLREYVNRLPPESPPDVSRMFFANNRLVNPRRVGPDVVDQVAKAIFECREIRFHYRKFEGNELEVQIRPWSILFADEGIYCLGYCVDSPRDHHIRRRRLYNLARVRQIALMDKRFTYPLRGQYDPVELFKYCFGIFLPPEDWAEPHDVIVRFAPTQRSYLESQPVHREQVSAEVDGEGWTVVKLRLFVSYDLVCWIRGLGKEAVAVSPPILVDWVSSGEGARFWKGHQEA